MKRHLKVRSAHDSTSKRLGRVRPFVLAAMIVVAGVLMNNELWKIGLIVMISLFIGGYYRYRTPY